MVDTVHRLSMIIFNYFAIGWWCSVVRNAYWFTDTVEQFASSSLQLKVNLSKSNIAVFRKGGYLDAREIWTYDSVVLQVVNAYNYLGVLFSTKLSFTEWYYDVTSKAKNAVLCIMQKLRMLNNNSFELFLNYLILKCNPSLSMVLSCGVLKQQRFIAKRYT